MANAMTTIRSLWVTSSRSRASWPNSPALRLPCQHDEIRALAGLVTQPKIGDDERGTRRHQRVDARERIFGDCDALEGGTRIARRLHVILGRHELHTERLAASRSGHLVLAGLDHPVGRERGHVPAHCAIRMVVQRGEHIRCGPLSFGGVVYPAV